jgi:hypothetical protein
MANAGTNRPSLKTEAQKEALRRNPDYIKYIQNLVSANYFKGEIEGSTLWNNLENKAATTFVTVRREEFGFTFGTPQSVLTSCPSDATRQSFAALVIAAVSQTANIPPTFTHSREDSDEWLYIDAENFDNMLEKSMGTFKDRTKQTSDDMDANNELQEDHVANTQASKLQNLAAKVEEFVEGEGDLEGAIFKE